MSALQAKTAAVTGGASGIGRASVDALVEAGARVAVIDRDAQALQGLVDAHGGAVVPVVIDLLDPADCATLLPKVLDVLGHLDIFHANAGIYVGGDLVDASGEAIDRMLNLNVNVVMKNVRDVLTH